jgi:hypothetical protein
MLVVALELGPDDVLVPETTRDQKALEIVASFMEPLERSLVDLGLTVLKRLDLFHLNGRCRVILGDVTTEILTFDYTHVTLAL